MIMFCNRSTEISKNESIRNRGFEVFGVDFGNKVGFSLYSVERSRTFLWEKTRENNERTETTSVHVCVSQASKTFLSI
jgi:hypothetical protein